MVSGILRETAASGIRTVSETMKEETIRLVWKEIQETEILRQETSKPLKILPETIIPADSETLLKELRKFSREASRLKKEQLRIIPDALPDRDW